MSYPATMDQATLDDLESLVDRFGMSRLLDALADLAICKGEHLRANWQDKESAKVWERDAKRIRAIANKMESV